MPIIKRLFTRLLNFTAYTTGSTITAYTLLNYFLSKRYPEVTLGEIPPQSQITTKPIGLLTPINPYNPNKTKLDNFSFYKTTLHNTTLNRATTKFLKNPVISLIFNRPPYQGGGQLVSAVGSASREPTEINYKSYLIKWLHPLDNVLLMENLAENGWPYRIYNGGLHELLVIGKTKGEVDVWLLSSLEYNDLKDGKDAGFVVKGLHKTLNRLILFLGTW